MEIQQNRRARLAALIRDKYGTQAKFIEATGENQSEISGLLRSKSFGERKARKLEEKCGLPAGWFDLIVVDEAHPARTGDTASLHEFPRQSVGFVATPGSIATSEPGQRFSLIYVTDREMDLLTHYRQASDIGKSLVETAAESAATEESGTGSAHQF